MALSTLSLSQFRNHEASRIAAGSRFNVIWGDNGAGKTNILEAISLLAPGRGMRRAAIEQMARQQGPGGFAIAAALMGEEVRIGTGTNADAPSRRQVRVNGAAAAATSLADWLAVVWLTPAMDRLFLESAGGRRRFLDRLVLALYPAHARHAARYEAAMRERNRLLSAERPVDPGWIDALEMRMAEHGAALAEARGAVRAIGRALGPGLDDGDRCEPVRRRATDRPRRLERQRRCGDRGWDGCWTIRNTPARRQLSQRKAEHVRLASSITEFRRKPQSGIATTLTRHCAPAFAEERIRAITMACELDREPSVWGLGNDTSGR